MPSNYQEIYSHSVADPEEFWAEAAETVHWYKKWEKVLNDFAKGNEKFVITGGAMPGQLMTAKQIAALAALPSREELIAKLLGTMQAPVAKLVRTLNEVPGKFVRTLAAVRDAKAASPAGN